MFSKLSHRTWDCENWTFRDCERLLLKDFKNLRFRKSVSRNLVIFWKKLRDFENQSCFRKNLVISKINEIFENTMSQTHFRNYTISKVYQKSKYFSSLYKREKTESTIREAKRSTRTRFRNLVLRGISKLGRNMFFKESNPKTSF